MINEGCILFYILKSISLRLSFILLTSDIRLMSLYDEIKKELLFELVKRTDDSEWDECTPILNSPEN